MPRLLLLLVTLAGCPEEQPPACTTVDLTCAPGYVPTFHNVYKNTLTVSCGSSDSSCHATNGHETSLDFGGTEDQAYASLMAASSIDSSRQRVTPGNAACSLLTVRTQGVGKDYQMPKGDALTPEARCAIVQWVENGAMMGSAQ